jgi:hypothetical protein
LVIALSSSALLGVIATVAKPVNVGQPINEGSMPIFMLSQTALETSDLDMLRRFLEAWCEENDVDIAGEQASEVAAGLIAWYQSDLTDRAAFRTAFETSQPLPRELDSLLGRLSAL